VRTLEDIVRGSVSNRTTVMQLLGAFAALALLLAAVGVYAVAAQSVLARRREIGLRMAVGARPGGVVRRVMGEELRPVLLGLGAGVLGSVWMGRALAGMLYEVAPGDPTTLVAVVAVLLAASAAALALPALRAMRVDPADALRTE
jgi:putative ABC transport system permease protein